MITTNEDILAASLVLQDVLYQSGTVRRPAIRPDPEIENKFAKHCIKLQEFIERGKKDFNFRFDQSFTDSTPAEEYQFLQTLGSGAFGSVLLAKRDSGYYAAKFMEKKMVMKNKQLTHVYQEIRILDAMRFEFLIYLEDFIRMNCYIVLVMPFINGGEMFEYFRKHGKCEEAQAKFYAAQVILAFEYMHAIGVIYRDLKPENIMFDEMGYIKIADFGFCKKVDNERTWSLCGTPEYLAPEIILNQGYNRSVDWWALGILIYEMTAGYPPFSSKDPIQLYDKIVNGFFTFPHHFSAALQNLLSNVIQVDKTRRYGVLKNGSKDIKCHAWFRTIDWSAILERTSVAPYKPKVESPEDASNFRRQSMLQIHDCREDEFHDEFANIEVKKPQDESRKLTTKAKSKGFLAKFRK